MDTDLRLAPVAVLFALAYALSVPAEAQEDDCVRGLPEPVVSARAAGVAEHAYRDLPERQALETVTLKDGLRLRVRHYGCAHYGLTFEFMSDAPKAKDGFGLLEETARFFDRLAKADPSSGANQFLEAISQARSLPAYNPGDSITVIEGYSWVVVTEATDSDGQRWVSLAYDVAL